MKKILALILALVMVFALVACGTTAAPAATEEPKTEEPAATEAPVEEPTETPAEPTEAPAEEPATVNADDIEDTMTSADGKYEVAFVTDLGQLKDKSFNQGTWNGVKLYANENGLSYKYYQPANGDQATDDDRYDAMKAAAENGAKVVVCAGFLQATALEQAAKDYPEVKFVFIDGWSLGLENVAAIAFQEEQCGYLAGYAAVMEGYTKLGFCGGGGGIPVTAVAVQHDRQGERNIRIFLVQRRTVFQILNRLFQMPYLFIKQSPVEQGADEGRLYFQRLVKGLESSRLIIVLNLAQAQQVPQVGVPGGQPHCLPHLFLGFPAAALGCQEYGVVPVHDGGGGIPFQRLGKPLLRRLGVFPADGDLRQLHGPGGLVRLVQCGGRQFLHTGAA